MRIPSIIPLIAGFLLGNPNLLATTRFVDVNCASPYAPYLSWSQASTNIQQAVNHSNPGDDIWVAAGTYEENLTLNKGVALYGGFDGNETNAAQRNWAANVAILDGRQSNSVIVIAAGPASLTRVDGFTIRNGLADKGGGILCTNSPAIIAHNQIVTNFASVGGGLNCWGSSMVIVSNLIQGNVTDASSAGLLAGLAPIIIRNNLFLDNVVDGGDYGTAAGGMYVVDSQDPVISGNLISGNRVSGKTSIGGGILIVDTMNACIVNNTFGTNRLEADLINLGAAILSNGNTNLLIANNILVFDTVGLWSSGDASIRATNNCVFGHHFINVDQTNGNIFADPRFAGPTDFRLAADSPCINAGNNGFVTDAIDLDGNARVSGGTVDFGAYELQDPPSIISYAWLQQYGLATDGSADHADNDNDGMNTWQEWRAGTSPLNDLSVLRMLSLSKEGSEISVSWQSVSNVAYVLERSPLPGDGTGFLPIQSNLTGRAGSTSFIDTNAGLGPRVYYRVGVR